MSAVLSSTAHSRKHLTTSIMVFYTVGIKSRVITCDFSDLTSKAHDIIAMCLMS